MSNFAQGRPGPGGLGPSHWAAPRSRYHRSNDLIFRLLENASRCRWKKATRCLSLVEGADFECAVQSLVLRRKRAQRRYYSALTNKLRRLEAMRTQSADGKHNYVSKRTITGSVSHGMTACETAVGSMSAVVFTAGPSMASYRLSWYPPCLGCRQAHLSRFLRLSHH
jgi:hypothetical protein